MDLIFIIIITTFRFQVFHVKLAWTHSTVDKAFGWKELLSKIIWMLQVQSQLQVRITRNTYHNLTLATGQG